MLEPFNSRCARCASVLVLATGLAAGAVVAGTQSADAQGLFEALFGRREPSFAPTLTIPFEHRPSARAATPKRKSLARPSRTHRAPFEMAQKPAPYRPPEVLPGPLGRFLKDPTLRPGDVVVTVDGLKVFRGPGGGRHRSSQFVSVDQAGPLITHRTRADLAKIEVATGALEVASQTPTRFVESREPIVAHDDGVRLQ